MTFSVRLELDRNEQSLADLRVLLGRVPQLDDEFRDTRSKLEKVQKELEEIREEFSSARLIVRKRTKTEADFLTMALDEQKKAGPICPIATQRSKYKVARCKLRRAQSQLSATQVRRYEAQIGQGTFQSEGQAHLGQSAFERP